VNKFYHLILKTKNITKFYLICESIQFPIMTAITRLFDFPYYQQDKYTTIPDALVSKVNGFG
jgi:hypothetical protein